MKRVVSLLCSLAMLVSMHVMSASAESYSSHSASKSYYIMDADAVLTENGSPWKFYPDTYGNCCYQALNWMRYNRFLVVTTADGLPTNCTDEVYSEVMEWDAYAQRVKSKSAYSSDVLLDNMALLQSDYGSDAKFYVVSLTNTDTPPYAAARRFAQKYTTVQAALMLEQQEQGECLWNGTYYVVLSRDETNSLLQIGGAEQISDEKLLADYPELFSEDSSLLSSKATYSEWINAFTSWINLNGSDALHTIDGSIQLQAAQIATPYAIMLEASNTANQFCETYSNKYAACYPRFDRESSIMVYHAYSPWKNLGDANQDGTVNAIDATSVLMISAQMGVGNTDRLNEETEQFIDVNADGVINASDATIILQYAAAVGAGQNATIADYVK